MLHGSAAFDAAPTREHLSHSLSGAAAPPFPTHPRQAATFRGDVSLRSIWHRLSADHYGFPNPTI